MISVLVVDDDFMVADVHRRLVEQEPGFTVTGVVHNGRDALRHITEQPPDLILLDIYLPDVSGIEVLRASRANGGTADVLIISAARDYATVRAALQLGSFHFLIKPFPADVLTKRLQRFARFRRQLAGSHEVRQDDIDDAVQLLRATATSLPKGLSEVTMDLVQSVLANGTELTAGEVALASGVSRVSARRYLEHLVETGEARLRLRYGSTGRPEHLYRIRSAAWPPDR